MPELTNSLQARLRRIADTGQQPTLMLTAENLLKLPEYSLSIPTGTTIGKRWRRRIPPLQQASVKPFPFKWVVGEYFDTGNPKQVGILWYKVEITL